MIDEVVEKISDKYNENYGYVYDLCTHVKIKLILKKPKYVLNEVELEKEIYNISNRYYRMKAYKESI